MIRSMTTLLLAGAMSIAAMAAADAKCSPANAVAQRWQPSYVYFETGKSALSAAEKKKIAEQAKLAKANYIQLICLKGTADKQGDPKANERLSKARADAVAAEFARNGVARKMIETDGLGEPGGSLLGGAGASSAERRVEIRFTR
ncbi:MAG: OmpA family protein [Alphaproteobacteria bacterium]|nr:OmpA family protein [Alphaproteobacteria bacterium]